MFIPRTLFALVFSASSVLAQTANFDSCPPVAGVTGCIGEIWTTDGGKCSIGPLGPVPPQAGFPTTGSGWLILDVTGGSGNLTVPAGGPAPYPFQNNKTGNIIFSEVTLGTSISFDWTFVEMDCLSGGFYNDFFTVDIVDPATGMPVINVLWQDTFSGNYTSPAVTPNDGGSVPSSGCTNPGTHEVTPAGVPKKLLFEVPFELIGKVYDVQFHVGNSGDNTWNSYAWLDNIFLGSPSLGGSCFMRPGLLDVNPGGYNCVNTPSTLTPWVTTIDTLPTHGTGTLATILLLGFGGQTESQLVGPFELLCMPPYILDYGLGLHILQIPPGVVGLGLSTQGCRIEVGKLGNVSIVLTNAQDLIIG